MFKSETEYMDSINDAHWRLNPEAKAIWIAALREPDRKQTRRNLHDEDGQCCLGVACEVAAANGIEIEVTTGPTGIVAYAGHQSLPPRSVTRWLGSEYFDNPTIYFGMPLLDGVDRMELSVINDNWGFTFNQIADLIDYFL